MRLVRRREGYKKRRLLLRTRESGKYKQVLYTLHFDDPACQIAQASRNFYRPGYH